MKKCDQSVASVQAVDHIDLDESGLGEEEPDCGVIQEMPPGSLPYDTMEVGFGF